MSLDGSNGGIGGRLANAIVVKREFHPGTATNKTTAGLPEVGHSKKGQP
jgi:hypothetical protein